MGWQIRKERIIKENISQTKKDKVDSLNRRLISLNLFHEKEDLIHSLTIEAWLKGHNKEHWEKESRITLTHILSSLQTTWKESKLIKISLINQTDLKCRQWRQPLCLCESNLLSHNQSQTSEIIPSIRLLIWQNLTSSKEEFLKQ